MARSFHRRDRMSAFSGIEISPLMDLAFSMLIIFMISTPLVEQTIHVELPVESPSQQEPQVQKSEVVAIDEFGHLFWGERAVDEELLTQLLEEAATRQEQPVIRLRADRSIQYQRVVDVIDMIKKAGLAKLDIDTQAGGR